MKTVLYYLKIYSMITAQYIKSRMQFKVDFIVSSVGILFANVAGLLSFWVIFKSISTLEGLSYYELLFIYSFSILALSPLQIFFDNIWSIWSHLINGTFIKYYLKPLNTMFYFLTEVFDLKGLSQFVFGIVLFVYSSQKLNIEWSFLQLVLLVISILSASLVIISLMTLAASTGFWVTNPFSVLSLVFKFKDFARYPVTIFNNFFKFFFTFIMPIGFIAFYPSQLFLESNRTTILAYCAPFVGVALFAIASFVWNRGIKNYSGTGS